MRYRLMATYRGGPYEAGVGPSGADVVLFAAGPPGGYAVGRPVRPGPRPGPGPGPGPGPVAVPRVSPARSQARARPGRRRPGRPPPASPDQGHLLRTGGPGGDTPDGVRAGDRD